LAPTQRADPWLMSPVDTGGHRLTPQNVQLVAPPSRNLDHNLIILIVLVLVIVLVPRPRIFHAPRVVPGHELRLTSTNFDPNLLAPPEFHFALKSFTQFHIVSRSFTLTSFGPN
jgi:hypothetical protein